MIPEHYRECQQAPYGLPCRCAKIKIERDELLAEHLRFEGFTRIAKTGPDEVPLTIADRAKREGWVNNRLTQGRRKAID